MKLSVTPAHLARVASATAVLCCSLFSERAEAVECNDQARLGTCIDADILWPHAGPGRLQSIGAVETTAPQHMSFGLVTTYLHKPIVLRAAGPDPAGSDVPAVEHLLNTNFLWAYGVADDLQLSLAMPVTLYQTGQGVSPFTSSDAQDLPTTALRDLRLGLAYALIPRPRQFPGSHYGLTARLEVSAPLGEQDYFAGDRGAVWAPSLAADYRRGRWFAGAEAGARIRPVTNLAGARVGTQAFFGLGMGYDILAQEQLSAALEAYALPTLVAQQDLLRDPTTRELVAQEASRTLLPAEWMATVRTAPTPDGDATFSLSGGTAIPLTSESSVTAPEFRFVLGIRFAALERDSDFDGVPDRDDLCPNEQEDRDGFEDQDGCIDHDNDRDGIPDAADRCRDRPEDKDGHEDEDGCPDEDDDGDGIPDVDDQCRDKPEDRDGFQDEDGCPDPDNDNDGIPDTLDACPDAAEDMDGYNDADGCPDPDNDMDGIPDVDDKCPLEPEDKDGFEDEDGCPDPDNDRDGVPDERDQCPLEPETINGIDDADGCPEPGARDLTIVRDDSVTVQTPVRFGQGSAKMSPNMQTQLIMAAQRALGMQPVRMIIVQTYADRPGATDKNEELAADRADAIRRVLLDAGLPPKLLTVAAGDLEQQRPAAAPQYDITVETAR